MFSVKKALMDIYYDLYIHFSLPLTLHNIEWLNGHDVWATHQRFCARDFENKKILKLILYFLLALQSYSSTRIHQ